MKLAVLALALLQPAAAPAPVARNPNLKYFSVYGGGMASPSELKGWVNFLSTDSNATQLARLHRAVGPGFSSLYPVHSTFFCGQLLCPDWQSRWQALYASTIKPGIAAKWLMGVHFGDELIWSCTPWANLSAAADFVRADLPRGTAILTYNEAYPVFVTAPAEAGSLTPNEAGLWQWNCDTGGGHHNRTPAPGMRINGTYVYPRVPDSLDWLSLDYYPSEGTVAGTIRLFQEQIYPKLSPSQSVMFVPPGYSSNTLASRNSLCCSNATRDGPNPRCDGNCTQAMLQWASGVWDWVRADTRVVGLNVWHYDMGPAKGGEYEPGLLGMPSVLRSYQAIGREILSGKQGAVDFGLP